MIEIVVVSNKFGVHEPAKLIQLLYSLFLQEFIIWTVFAIWFLYITLTSGWTNQWDCSNIWTRCWIHKTIMGFWHQLLRFSWKQQPHHFQLQVLIVAWVCLSRCHFCLGDLVNHQNNYATQAARKVISWCAWLWFTFCFIARHPFLWFI